MYIKIKDASRSLLVNLDAYGGIRLDDGTVSFNTPAVSRIMNEGTPEELQARFDDIAEALNSGKVVVYDANKDVGYWKPKTTTKKATPKAPAKAPEGK